MKKITIISMIITIVLFFNQAHFGTVSAVSDNNCNINAKNYVVIHCDTFKVLDSKDEHERRQVASICKLMTTFITLEKLDSGEIHLDDSVLASKHAISMEGSRAYLDNDYYTIEELLKSVIVASANDSAVVLAEYIGGSEDNFVRIMNNTAIELGMTDTLYANATGLPNANQYSSAYDTAIILSRVAEHDLYKEYSNIWMDTIVHSSGRVTDLVNTNRLVKYYEYTLCGKTGFTDEAGYCLSSMASKDGMKLITVVLGCDKPSDRFTDSITLYNKIYSSYYLDTLLTAFTPIQNDIKVNKGKSNTINIAIKENIVVLKNNNIEESYVLKYDLPYSIKAPFNQGDTIGCIHLILDGIILKTYEVISMDTIEKADYVDYIKDIINRFGQN